MSQSTAVILSSGGLRSLVALAVVQSQTERSRVVTLHIRDGRENASIRLEHARRQAEHFKAAQRIELELPHLQPDAAWRNGPRGQAAGQGPSAGRASTPSPSIDSSSGASPATAPGSAPGGFTATASPAAGVTGSPLVRPQVLLAAMAQALEFKAGRLVWPVQFDGDYAHIARATEQTVLAQHLAQLEHPHVPAIDTPLIELSDVQLLELGAQLDVPWRLAWSCLSVGPQPCQVCIACRRRRTAFEQTGLVDPLDAPARTPR